MKSIFEIHLQYVYITKIELYKYLYILKGF